jgi:hypothetical protein
MMTQPSAAEIQRFFEGLYTDVEDGWLVLSRPDPDPAHVHPKTGKRWLRSEWLDLAQTPLTRAATIAATLSQQDTVYFGVAIQRPDCSPGPYHRSTNIGAYIVPGLWFDLDLSYGQHATSKLPATDGEAIDFLCRLPAAPSLLIHSGGGLYGYWLFREPYVIGTDAEHHAMSQLAKQFAYTLMTAGKSRDWTLDALGDMARVLRPPGTINYKYAKSVAVLHESGTRYNPSDFDWLLDLPAPARAAHAGAAVTGQPDLVTIAEYYGTTLERKSKDELAGPHPQHGSSTGDNFNINVQKGLWHCWRHGTGGDALALIAVCEGLLDCEQAHSGALRGDLFQRVVALANAQFDAGIRPNGRLDHEPSRASMLRPLTTTLPSIPRKLRRIQ